MPHVCRGPCGASPRTDNQRGEQSLTNCVCPPRSACPVYLSRRTTRLQGRYPGRLPRGGLLDLREGLTVGDMQRRDPGGATLGRYRACAKPGCPNVTQDVYCDKHKPKASDKTRRRSTSYQHLYVSRRWKTNRKAFLTAHPICNICKTRAATVVDHIEPHKGDLKMFWDRSNWQALCKPCHDRKTATEDGGFGNPRGV